jgi:hypothetical protein
MGGAVALGLSVFLAVPVAHAQPAGTAPAPTKTIYVPTDFDKQLQDVRADGHYELVADGLHIWTQGSGDQDANGKNLDKVAEYVDTNTPLSAVTNPSLDFTQTDASTAPGIPGYQLVVDLDGDKTPDGILVGEPGAYGNDWWLPSAWNGFDLATAPGAADGYAHSGPLAAWKAAFPDAQVVAFGFSLGSGVHGDGTLHAIDFAGTRYTFADDVVMSKDDCKDGGWAKSKAPVYKNQGECVSRFATTSNSGKGSGSNTGTVTGTGTATAAATPAAAAEPAVVTPLNAGKIRAI